MPVKVTLPSLAFTLMSSDWTCGSHSSCRSTASRRSLSARFSITVCMRSLGSLRQRLNQQRVGLELQHLYRKEALGYKRYSFSLLRLYVQITFHGRACYRRHVSSCSEQG